MRQSERRRLVPVEDLTSDLNSETDFNHSVSSISSSVRNHNNRKRQTPITNNNRSNMRLDVKTDEHASCDDIKTPDFDVDSAFQVTNILINVY